MSPKSFSGIGLMSGTSLDGVDLAFASFTEAANGKWDCRPGKAITVPFSENWSNRLSQLSGKTAEIFAKTDVDFGRYLGRIIIDFIEKFELSPDFVASHGHTIFHQPANGFTSQIGDGETIASFLSVPLVSNFRNKNLAMSGEGAPLVPFGEKVLFPEGQVFINIGGISNLGYNGLGFDITVANIALNYLASIHDSSLKFDLDGLLARNGTVDENLLKELNSNPFFNQSPPKSLGLEWFNENQRPVLQRFIDSGFQKTGAALRTFVEHVAIQVLDAIHLAGAAGFPVFFTGGGARNVFLMERFTQKGIQTATFEDSAWIDFKEAIIFAFLGLQVLLGRPNTLASVTGAKMDALCGSIHLPAAGGFPIFKNE